MKFSVLTASYKQLGWLKRAIRSVADQEGVEVEHLIQDGNSGPELVNYVRENTNASIVSEPDRGMYDALNKAFDRVTGDVFSILNCDEQYLPGTLARVKAEFEAYPDTDLVIGDCLLINPENELIAFRRSTPLRESMILTDHLYDLTCTLFFHRRVLDRGIRFDAERFRAAGDADWVVRLLRSGLKMRLIRHYTATFLILPDNLSLTDAPKREGAYLEAMAPGWARALAPVLRCLRHVEKWLAGGYSSGPIEYAIYATDDAGQRTTFRCEKPSFRHPWGK